MLYQLLLGVSAAKDLHDDTQNHKEPSNGNDLQNKKSGEEGPADGGVPAYDAVRLVERLQHPALAFGDGQRSVQVGVLAGVARVGDLLGDVGVDGPAHHQVEDVAGHQPRQDKGAEHEVAESVQPDVLEALGELCAVSGWRMKYGRL